MNPMDHGALVISLDFELLWGVFDKVDWKKKKEYFHNTRKVIPQILELFEAHEISATWAIVGMLFNKDWEEWNNNRPEVLPDYQKQNFSAYKFGEGIQKEETESLCFAPDLIQMIAATPGQEIGTHTYSHYYCLEKGQTAEAFKADLEKSVQLAQHMGIYLKSLVFPRNQFNTAYLKICADLGITSVRSNPFNWYWRDTQNSNLTKKIFRTGDAYFGFMDKSYPPSEIIRTVLPVEQPASRLLKPFKGNIFDAIKLKRIKNEILYAAKNKEVYHLWWHPHNFGNNSLENLRELEDLLKYVQYCQSIYGMQSFHMQDISNLQTT